MAATWCRLSFARGTSACLRRWGSDVVTSQVRVCTQCFGRHSAASSSSSSSSEWSPTTSHSLHLSRSPACGMKRNCSKCCIVGVGRWVGSVPDPADPEIDTRASQPRRGEKTDTRTSEQSFTHGTLCTARDPGAWLVWVGGWPKVCVCWLVTLSWSSAHAEERVLVPRPRLCSGLWCLC